MQIVSLAEHPRVVGEPEVLAHDEDETAPDRVLVFLKRFAVSRQAIQTFIGGNSIHPPPPALSPPPLCS